MALLTPIGTTFAVAASGSTLVDVADVTGIDGPSSSVEALETTSLTSSTVTRIAGRTDWGTVTVNLNLSDSNASEMDALGGTLVDWKITIPNGDDDIEISGSAVMSQLNVSVQGGSVVTGSLTLQVSGDVTIEEVTG